MDAFAMPQASLLGTGWQLEPQGKRDLLERLRAAGTPLTEWCGGHFYYGVKTGLNKAFVIDGATRAALIAADPKSEAIIKPFLRGRDVKRWTVEPGDHWLIKIPSSDNADHPWKGKADEQAERVFAEAFPAIYAWWIAQELRDPLIARADQGRYFWELRSCAYWDAFDQPKIVFPDIALRPEMGFDESASYLANTGYIIPTQNRSVLAVLNSSAVNYFYAQISPQIQNGYYRFIAQYVGQIPIPVAMKSRDLLIAPVVDAILAGAQPRAQLEALLNAFVYELFFPEEVGAVGSAFAAAREAGLERLAALTGPALARGAEDWARTLSDPSSPLYRSLFALQSLESVRIIEGRT